jgi:DNA-binding NtrC family response regulator
MTAIETNWILVVTQQPETSAMVSDLTMAGCGGRCDIRFTVTGSANDAIEMDCVQPHDVAIVDDELPGTNALALARKLLAIRSRPIVLITRDPRVDRLTEAMRIGIADCLQPPFTPAIARLAIQRCLHIASAAKREHQKHQNMRKLLRRVLRDRRHLNHRIDLLCRDMVGAQRRLFHRVLALEDR